jgi:zinc protease
MKIRLSFVIVLCSISMAASAAPRAKKAVTSQSKASGVLRSAPDVGKLAIPYRKFVLDNGLTLLVHEDHSVPIVSVNSWYHVGSRNEKRGKTGFAHLFEHFFFDGSEHYPHGFREVMDDLGATNRNGTTNGDRTNFFEDVPVSGLERTLYLEADRMGYLEKQLSKEMLERERGVVQNEKRQGDNRPYAAVDERIIQAIYPYSHPYSWTTIGSMEDLNAASLEDVREWYRTYYGPNNAVLSLAGDITAERALELVKKYFGGIPPGPPLNRLDEWVPRLDRNIRDEVEDRVPRTRIDRVYPAPGWRNADVPLLRLTAGILSGTKSARLDRRLIYEKQLATEVDVTLDVHEIASEFYVEATLKPGVDAAEAEREIDAVMAALLRDGPSEAELGRARSLQLARFAHQVEFKGGFGGRSDVLAESMTFGGSPDAYLERLRAIASATPATTSAAANRWLASNHYTIVARPFPALAASKTMLDRSVLPPLGDTPAITFPKVQRAQLANGLKVLLLERHGAPLVNMVVAVDAGMASDPSDKAGVGTLALSLMDQGTVTRDAFRIADDLAAQGARLTTGFDLDTSYARLSALSASLSGALDVFSDVLLHPAYPEEMVAIGKRQRLADIEQEKTSPMAATLRVLPRLLYGAGHPYSGPLTGSGQPGTVATLTPDDLRSWHRTWFRPDNSTVVVTGDVTMDVVRRELERTFGSWQKGNVPAKNVTTPTPMIGGKVYLIDRPDAPQSVIRVAALTLPSGQPDSVAIETVMRDFGGMSTSRLNRNLRLDKHWSYGSNAQLIGARGPRPFLIAAPVQTDKTKEAMIEVARELRGIAGERPIAGDEFASIMRTQTMGLPGRFDSLSSLERAGLEIVEYGYPEDYYPNFAQRVRALTEQDLGAAAKKYLPADKVIWLVVGDLKKIEPGIRELGLGEIVKINAEGEVQ